LVVNVVLPGVGTMISGCSASEPFFVLVGLCQLLSTVLVVGWFWAQFTSKLLISEAYSKEVKDFDNIKQVSKVPKVYKDQNI
jgi:hypothetical protein